MTSRLSKPAFLASLPLQSRSIARPSLNKRPNMIMALEIGQHVRVTKSLIMYHYPGKKNTPVDVEGFEGEIVRNISVHDGAPMTATAPYVVKFPDHPRFLAHFDENELELL